MNKQAITFFSLFSLILVLSVYYVMIPPIDDSIEITQAEESLKDKLSLKRNEETDIQNNILASSSSSGEELNKAIESINETKQAISIETKITNELNKLGYQNVFCEIDQTVIKITITYPNASKDDAIKVMDVVMKNCNEKYSPEIKFINE